MEATGVAVEALEVTNVENIKINFSTRIAMLSENAGQTLYVTRGFFR